MTSGVDLLVAAWRSLDAGERTEAMAIIERLHEREGAGERSEFAELLDGLRAAADYLGEPPSPDSYDLARRELRELGEELPPRSRIIRRFQSWREAKEALGLYSMPSKTTTARRIEARFESRHVGKVWRCTDAVLAETMAAAVAYWGRPPRVAEFDHWRERELELRRARGEVAPHLPSPSPYRKRWRNWDGALLALGYEPTAIAERFDPTITRPDSRSGAN